MLGSTGDIDRLVFRQQFYRIANADLCRAGNNHPMFSTVMVHLQRESLTRVDRDSLDLESMTIIDFIISAPWSKHLAMVKDFRPFHCTQLINDCLDLLRP